MRARPNANAPKGRRNSRRRCGQPPPRCCVNDVSTHTPRIGEAAFVAAMAFVKAGMIVPPRTLVAGIPARIVRELSDTELAWKIEGTRSYQDLTRRSLATMRATAPLTTPEPNRKHIDLPELLPLSTLKKQFA